MKKKKKYVSLGKKYQMGGNIKPKFEEFYKSVNPEFSDTTAYELREAYNELPLELLENWAKDPDTHHLPDTYKLPDDYRYPGSKGHPTFSVESKYYKPGMKSGYWIGETYIPLKKGELPPKDYQKGGNVKPIYVTDPNDPRYVAYQDSLIAWRGGEDMYKYYKETLAGIAKDKNFQKRHNVEINQVASKELLTHPYGITKMLPLEASSVDFNRVPPSLKERILGTLIDYSYKAALHGIGDGPWEDNGTFYKRYKKPVQPVEISMQDTPSNVPEGQKYAFRKQISQLPKRDKVNIEKLSPREINQLNIESSNPNINIDNPLYHKGELIQDFKGVPNIKVVSSKSKKTGRLEPFALENENGERIDYRKYSQGKFPKDFQHPKQMKKGGKVKKYQPGGEVYPDHGNPWDWDSYWGYERDYQASYYNQYDPPEHDPTQLPGYKPPEYYNKKPPEPFKPFESIFNNPQVTGIFGQLMEGSQGEANQKQRDNFNPVQGFHGFKYQQGGFTPLSYQEVVQDWKDVPNLKLVSALDVDGRLKPVAIENQAGQRVDYKSFVNNNLPKGFQYAKEVSNTNEPRNTRVTPPLPNVNLQDDQISMQGQMISAKEFGLGNFGQRSFEQQRDLDIGRIMKGDVRQNDPHQMAPPPPRYGYPDTAGNKVWDAYGRYIDKRFPSLSPQERHDLRFGSWGGKSSNKEDNRIYNDYVENLGIVDPSEREGYIPPEKTARERIEKEKVGKIKSPKEAKEIREKGDGLGLRFPKLDLPNIKLRENNNNNNNQERKDLIEKETPIWDLTRIALMKQMGIPVLEEDKELGLYQQGGYPRIGEVLSRAVDLPITRLPEYKENWKQSDIYGQYSDEMTAGTILNDPKGQAEALDKMSKSLGYKDTQDYKKKNKIAWKNIDRALVNEYSIKRLPEIIGEHYPTPGGKSITMPQDIGNYQLGGNINTTGYTPGFKSFNNKYNIIPSGDISMKDTPFPVVGKSLETGEVKIMKPGQKYKFKNTKNVLEIPLDVNQGMIPEYQMGGSTGGAPSEENPFLSLQDPRNTLNYGQRKLVEIQTEKGEFISSPYGDIVKVTAKEKHKNMDDDKVTEQTAEGNYVHSDDKSMTIVKDKGVGRVKGIKFDEVIMGKDNVYYEEGKLNKEIKEYKLSDIEPNKKRYTFADLTENLSKKFPVTTREKDPFAMRAQVENKQSRVPYLEKIIELSELKRPTQMSKPNSKYKKGGFAHLKSIYQPMIDSRLKQLTDNAITGTMFPEDPLMDNLNKIDNALKYNRDFTKQPTSFKNPITYQSGGPIYDDREDKQNKREQWNWWINQAQGHFNDFTYGNTLPSLQGQSGIQTLGVLAQPAYQGHNEFLYGNQYRSQLDNLANSQSRSLDSEQDYASSLVDQSKS